GDDKKILLQRHGVYQKAMKENPGRWPGKKTRNWEAVGDVTLNPAKDKEMNQPVNQAE
ncbi:IS3 family transposase, partial [Oceanospirillum sp. D5]|nr:IS3 family transposase [Oceanospirillum sediminis]